MSHPTACHLFKVSLRSFEQAPVTKQQQRFLANTLVSTAAGPSPISQIIDSFLEFNIVGIYLYAKKWLNIHLALFSWCSCPLLSHQSAQRQSGFRLESERWIITRCFQLSLCLSPVWTGLCWKFSPKEQSSLNSFMMCIVELVFGHFLQRLTCSSLCFLMVACWL